MSMGNNTDVSHLLCEQRDLILLGVFVAIGHPSWWSAQFPLGPTHLIGKEIEFMGA